MSDASPLNIAIACGGTGGHLFPGLAVAERLQQRGCAVTLLISPKEVDQQAVKAAKEMEIVTLPAVGLTRGGRTGFCPRLCWSVSRREKAFQATRARRGAGHGRVHQRATDVGRAIVRSAHLPA